MLPVTPEDIKYTEVKVLRLIIIKNSDQGMGPTGQESLHHIPEGPRPQAPQSWYVFTILEDEAVLIFLLNIQPLLEPGSFWT